MMTQKQLIVVALVVIVLAAAFNGYLGLHALGRVDGQQHTLATTQAAGLIAQKASAVARISTIQSRCELTSELETIIGRRDAAGAKMLDKSRVGCDAQLVQVKRLAAATP